MRSLILLAAASAACADNFIPASDPGIQYNGRFQVNPDGTRSFDWEGNQIWINLQNAGYLAIQINSTGPMTRLLTQIQAGGRWFDQTRVWVSPSSRTGTNVYRIADNMYANSTLRVFHELEPAFSGAQNGPDQTFTFIGFWTDGTAGPASPPLTRNIEVIGDSISAGYGSQCTGGGPVMDWTSGNYGTYNQLLCDYFQANCSIIAWSGKGMYENCCDNGETMPSYYLQTRGSGQYTRDWDFFRFTPDALVINLGTNDFNHDNGTAWEAAFTTTYVQFVLNATVSLYKNPTMPVFLGQGPMNNGQPLHDALQAAITAINAARGNDKAYYLDMRGPPLDGCGGHPGVAGHAGMFALAKPVIATAMGWAWQGSAGYISTGGDVIPAASYTVDAAKSLCTSTPGCLGITYAQEDPSPSAPVLVYFKNHTDVGGGQGSGWYTWVDLAKA